MTAISVHQWSKALVRDEDLGWQALGIALACQAVGGSPGGVVRINDQMLARRFGVAPDLVVAVWDALAVMGYAERLADQVTGRRQYGLRLPAETSNATRIERGRYDSRRNSA